MRDTPRSAVRARAGARVSVCGGVAGDPVCHTRGERRVSGECTVNCAQKLCARDTAAVGFLPQRQRCTRVDNEHTYLSS